MTSRSEAHDKTWSYFYLELMTIVVTGAAVGIFLGALIFGTGVAAGLTMGISSGIGVIGFLAFLAANDDRRYWHKHFLKLSNS